MESRGERSRRVAKWYLARCPRGCEAAYAERIVAPLSGVAGEAFCPGRERWRRGWHVEPLWPGYIVVAARDSRDLARGLALTGLPVEAAGDPRAWRPLARDACAWLESVMDGGCVVRHSEGEIVAGELRVSKGPLAGNEACVSFIDRHHRSCKASPCEGLSIEVGLEVTRKTPAGGGA